MIRNLSISSVAATVFFILLCLSMTGAQTCDKVSTSLVTEGDSRTHSMTMNVRVTDPTGTPIPNAGVAVLGVGNRVVAERQTDPHGEFQSVGVAPGTYSVRVTASGFKVSRKERYFCRPATERSPFGLFPSVHRRFGWSTGGSFRSAVNGTVARAANRNSQFPTSRTNRPLKKDIFGRTPWYVRKL